MYNFWSCTWEQLVNQRDQRTEARIMQAKDWQNKDISYLTQHWYVGHFRTNHSSAHLNNKAQHQWAHEYQILWFPFVWLHKPSFALNYATGRSKCVLNTMNPLCPHFLTVQGGGAGGGGTVMLWGMFSWHRLMPLISSEEHLNNQLQITESSKNSSFRCFSSLHSSWFNHQ